MNAGALLARLDGVQGRGPWRAICPAHESKHGTRSLAIREEGERTLFHCFAGCDGESILDALGLDWEAVMPPRQLGEHPPIKKPWSRSSVIHALRDELMVSALLLSEVANGKELTSDHRARANLAFERISHALVELEGAA